MKITGKALYLKWNENDRNRWNALPEKSKSKWDVLASMYDGGLSINVTEIVQEHLVNSTPRIQSEDWIGKGFGESIIVTDRVNVDGSTPIGEPNTDKPNPSDDEIVKQAEKQLKEVLMKALDDPEVRMALISVLYPVVNPEPESKIDTGLLLSRDTDAFLFDPI